MIKKVKSAFFLLDIYGSYVFVGVYCLGHWSLMIPLYIYTQVEIEGEV